MAFNKVILTGNLTRDPEHRVTPSGVSVCKIGLASSRVFTTSSGEKREETAFVDITAFGKQADTISKFKKKGDPMLIEGRLKLDQWETEDKQKRSKLSVVLETFQFLSSGNGSEKQDKAVPEKREPSQPIAKSDPIEEDEVPF